MSTFIQVFIAFHGCWYQEFQYFQRNFNTFACLKSGKSIFAKEFKYFWVPSICARLTFFIRIMLFQRFWSWLYQNVNFYTSFYSIPWMLISGISIFPKEFQYFCVFEIRKINICYGISILLSAVDMCSAHFFHTYNAFSTIFMLIISTCQLLHRFL